MTNTNAISDRPPEERAQPPTTPLTILPTTNHQFSDDDTIEQVACQWLKNSTYSGIEVRE